MNIVGMNSPDQLKVHDQVLPPFLLPNFHLLARMGSRSTDLHALAEVVATWWSSVTTWHKRLRKAADFRRYETGAAFLLGGY